MADPLYARLRDGTADRLIAKYGQDLILRRTTEGAYDPAQGKPARTTADVAVRGIVFGEEKVELAGGNLVRTGVFKVILSATGLSVVPQTIDRLVINGAAHEIQRVDAVAPGGVAVIYELEVAR